MAKSLFWLSDEAWKVLNPHLPRGKPGKPRVVDRTVISAHGRAAKRERIPITILPFFLREMPDRFAELHRLADVSTAILYDTSEVVNALPYREEAYNDPRTPLMHEIRREGVDQ